MPRIMCHHYEMSDTERDLIEDKVARMKKFYDKVHEVSVILDAAKNSSVAEILIFGAHVNLRVSHEAPDMRAAFEAAVNKAERALRKHKEKKFGNRIHHRNAVTIRKIDAHALRNGATAPTEAGHDNSFLEKVEPKPMTIEEAQLQLRGENREIMVFINAETSELNLLHLISSDGECELVELGKPEFIPDTVEVEIAQ